PARRPPDRAAAPPDQLRSPLHRRRQREPAHAGPSARRHARRQLRGTAGRGAPVGLGPGVSPRYLALAADYDGTLAYQGRVEEATPAARRRGGGSGRPRPLLPGRALPSLPAPSDPPALSALGVAETGGLLSAPATGRERALADPPPPRLVEALRARGVTPLS